MGSFQGSPGRSAAEKVDLALERQLGDMLVNMSRDGMIDAARRVCWWSGAALSQETCLRFNLPVPALVWVRLLSVTAWTCSPAVLAGPWARWFRFRVLKRCASRI